MAGPASIDIKDLLEGAGLSLVFPTNLFVGFEPPKPDNCVVIFDSGAMPPDLTMDKAEIYEHPRLQIRIRNLDYEAGFNLAILIKDTLHGVGSVTVNGSVYSVIRCVNGPSHLDWDGNKRARFIITFVASRSY